MKKIFTFLKPFLNMVIMNKLILLFFVAAFTLFQVSEAQNAFLPTVVDCRIWNVVSLHPAEPPESDSIPNHYKDIKGRWCIGFPHTFELKGDTVMNGITYKKLYLDGLFVSGLREEEGRIYECYWVNSPEMRIFDFNLRPGDIFKEEIDTLDQMEVKQVRTVSIGGKNRRCMDMWIYQEGMEIIDGLVDYWIEGIGCMNGPHFPFWWTATGDQNLLLSCYDSEKCLFSAEDFSQITNIQNVFIKDTSANGTGIFDLSGRQVAAPSKGIYIKEGKKVLVK